LISEKFIAGFQERTAVFDGQRLRDGAAAVLKLRFQCVHLSDLPILYPGGYLHVLAMSRVPGCSVEDIADLTDNELSIIRAQLTKILE